MKALSDFLVALRSSPAINRDPLLVVPEELVNAFGNAFKAPVNIPNPASSAD